MTTDRTLIEAVGWTATAVFVGSYFFTRAEILVRVQIAGALLWIVYGVAMRAPPVIAANMLVAGAAAWKASQGARSRSAPNAPDDRGEGKGTESPLSPRRRAPAARSSQASAVMRR